MTMTFMQYESIIWENETKKKILSHARAAYVEEVRPGTTLEIVTTRSSDKFILHLVAIHECSHRAKSKVLLSTKMNDTEQDGLEELVTTLQDQLSRIILEVTDDVYKVVYPD